MNMVDIIVGIILLITSVFATFVNTAPSQDERQPKTQIVSVILLIAFLIGIFAGQISSSLIGIYFGLGMFWPSLIAFFINWKTIDEPIGYSTPRWPMLIVALSIILVIFLFILPDTVSYRDGKPAIDVDYLMSQASFLFTAVPAIVFFFLLGVKSTVIYKNGIFYDGLLWAWSDFKNYQWENNNHNKKHIGLILSAKSLLFNQKIKLKIERDQKEFMDGLLAKEVR